MRSYLPAGAKPRDIADRSDTEEGRITYQQLSTAGQMLNYETLPTYYTRVNRAHQDGWITRVERSELMGSYTKFYTERVGGDVSKAGEDHG